MAYSSAGDDRIRDEKGGVGSLTLGGERGKKLVARRRGGGTGHSSYHRERDLPTLGFHMGAIGRKRGGEYLTSSRGRDKPLRSPVD